MITATAPRTGRWELVPTRTSVGFMVRNFGVVTVRGQIPVTAHATTESDSAAHGRELTGPAPRSDAA